MKSHQRGRRSTLKLLAGGALIGCIGVAPAVVSAATPWPTQPVKLVVPFAAGGSTDVFARLLARRLQEVYGQPFIVENRGGANGNLGAAQVATAAPDGYTLMLSTTGPLSINKLLYKATPFNPLTDFTPIALLADVPLLVASHPSLPVHNLKELIAYVKANPDKVAYSTGGTGSMGHLSALLLQRATGTTLTHVPYKGSSGALNDLIGGVVGLSFDLVPTYLQQISAGKINAIAVLGTQRTSSLPEIPTLVESGINVNATGWYGLVGPKGLPPEVVAKVNAVANEFLVSTEGRAQLQVFSMRPIGGKPEALMALMTSEMDKWRPIVEPISASVAQ
ncbi:tripartite tricarboxylate transporter substrate binding protein [soil metagenome]